MDAINPIYYALLKIITLFFIIIGIFIFVTLSIVIFAKKFNCEEKLFNGRVFSCLGRRKDFQNNITPSITDGALIFTLSLIALIYLGIVVQSLFEDIGVIITELIILAIPVLYAVYIKADLKDTFSLRLPKLKHIFGAFIIWFGGYFVINITTQILLALFPRQAEVLDAVNSSVMMDSLFASLVVVALIPAICEEVLFRGFILSSFKGGSKKSRIFAVVMVGVLFGIMHLSFIRIIPTAILGILFAYCVMKSKSIFTGVFMHFINNGFAVFVLYINENYLHIPVDSSNVAYTMPDLSSIIIVFGLGALFIFLGTLLFREKNKMEKDII